MMSMIDVIIIALVIIPIVGFITDIKKGKIKNLFIFPYFLCLGILGYFIEGFYQDMNNLIQIGICFILGFLFYIHNKWGAGDGKYIIILGFSLVIITFLKGFTYNIVYLFGFSFFIISIYCFYFLLRNKHNIVLQKVSFSKNMWIEIFFYFQIIYIIGVSFHYFFENFIYTYIIIFMIIMFLFPYIRNINMPIKIQLSIGILSIICFSYFQIIFLGYFISFLFFIFFYFLSKYIDGIFDSIDTKNINILDIKSGNILHESSLEDIKNEGGFDLQLSPLQGHEVFEIIKYYKENNSSQSIKIYNELKVGWMLYLGYVLSIGYMFLK